MSIAELRKLINLIESKSKNKAELAKLLNIDRATYYRLSKTGDFTFIQVAKMLKYTGVGLYIGSFEVEKLA